MSKVPEKVRQSEKRLRTQLINPDFDYNNLSSTGMSLMLQVVNICVWGGHVFLVSVMGLSFLYFVINC